MKTKNTIGKPILKIIVILFLTSCNGNNEPTSDYKEKIVEINPMKDKGIGPIIHVDISNVIDNNMAEKGEKMFNSMCSACHKINQRVIGPALTGVTKRRTPEWIMKYDYES